MRAHLATHDKQKESVKQPIKKINIAQVQENNAEATIFESVLEPELSRVITQSNQQKQTFVVENSTENEHLEPFFESGVMVY